MEPLQGFFLVLIAAWAPCVAVFAWLVWRAPLLRSEDEVAQGRQQDGARNSRHSVPIVHA